MFPTSRYSSSHSEVIGAAFSTPLVSVVLAMLVAGIVLAVRGRAHSRGLSDADALRLRHGLEGRVLGMTALAVIASFVIEEVVRGYIVNVPDVVSWWRFAVPLACASVGLAVLLGVITTRGTSRPEVVVSRGERRTWTTFVPRLGIFTAVVPFAVLLTTTVLAGFASSPNERGQYTWLVIPVPNEATIDPIRQWFYGWAYGIPVLVCAALLAVATWLVLRSNASRPYLRPETVIDERNARRMTAARAVHVALAAILISLAGAWRLIAEAGTGSELTVAGENSGEPYEVSWRYAELALAAGWCAPVLEIVAFALLVIVAGRALRSSWTASSESQRETAPSDASVL